MTCRDYKLLKENQGIPTETDTDYCSDYFCVYPNWWDRYLKDDIQNIDIVCGTRSVSDDNYVTRIPEVGCAEYGSPFDNHPFPIDYWRGKDQYFVLSRIHDALYPPSSRITDFVTPSAGFITWIMEVPIV